MLLDMLLDIIGYCSSINLLIAHEFCHDLLALNEVNSVLAKSFDKLRFEIFLFFAKSLNSFKVISFI